MPTIKDDEWHLKMMRRELGRYRRGKVALPVLVRALGRRIRKLTDARPELIERLREEWRIIEELNEIAAKRADSAPHARHQRMLEDSLRELNRLITLAWLQVSPANRSAERRQ